MTSAWKPDICIYHANCADGFGAAWAVWRRWGDEVLFVPASYGDEAPPVYGKDVLIVDFSYKRGKMLAIADAARSVVVLDHHKSAASELAGFKPLGDTTIDDVARKLGAPSPGAPLDQVRLNLLVGFDMERSGAVLAWRFCHPGRPCPFMLILVQDRDLWRFELQDSKSINAYLASLDHDCDEWDEAANLLATRSGRELTASIGAAILRKQAKDIGALLDASVRTMVIVGHSVPVANVPPMWASEAGNILAEGNRFAATYFDAADGSRKFSLRSEQNGADVAEIAAAYGGGGHAHAAGFTAPRGWEGDV